MLSGSIKVIFSEFLKQNDRKNFANQNSGLRLNFNPGLNQNSGLRLILTQG
jgi:hypothetical protein